MSPPVDIFVSYAQDDENFWRELEKQLSSLDRAGKIRVKNGHKTGPGENWLNVVLAHLDSATVILLLLTPDFFASDPCQDVEVEKALAQAHQGKARVIPIRVRPCDWDAVPFKHLRALPDNGEPVSTWPDRDVAWAEIARQIRLMLDGPLPSANDEPGAHAAASYVPAPPDQAEPATSPPDVGATAPHATERPSDSKEHIKSARFKQPKMESMEAELTKQIIGLTAGVMVASFYVFRNDALPVFQDWKVGIAPSILAALAVASWRMRAARNGKTFDLVQRFGKSCLPLTAEQEMYDPSSKVEALLSRIRAPHSDKDNVLICT
jgi:hypothetical protein